MDTESFKADRRRNSLSEEYFAILAVISEYDARFMTIKGWSVTTSLAGIGLGFTQTSRALFALAAVSAFMFWMIESLGKQHQVRYYCRMREIEVLGATDADDQTQFSPRIDWTWKKKTADTGMPVARSRRQMQWLNSFAFFFPWVFLPHLPIVALGIFLWLLT